MRHIPLRPGADDNLMRGSNDSSTTNGAMALMFEVWSGLKGRIITFASKGQIRHDRGGV